MNVSMNLRLSKVIGIGPKVEPVMERAVVVVAAAIAADLRGWVVAALAAHAVARDAWTQPFHANTA